MVEKKAKDAKSERKGRAVKAMSLCTAKLSNGNPCPKDAELGKVFCRWHDPEDETWREIYTRLEKSTSEERTDIVLELIEHHPEHILVLPDRGEQRANLKNIDLSTSTLAKRRLQSGVEEPSWWIEEPSIHIFDGSFQGANLRQANLKGANLVGANLRGADLSSADFMKANLQDADLSDTRLHRAVFFQANLNKTVLHNAKLEESNLMHANLQNASLGFANLERVNLNFANLQGSQLDSSYLKGAHLREVKLQGVDLSSVDNMINIYISDAWLDRTRLYQPQLGGAIGEELEHDYAAAKRGYLILKQNFESLGDYEAASWAYCKERRMEKNEAWQQKKYSKFLSDTIVELLCDYGESVWRVIGWMAVLLFLVGPLLFSGLGGIEWSTELKKEYFELSSFARFGFWYCTYLLYTLDTLTTASFSGLQPINDAVKFASGFFAIIGIFLAGLLGFVAGNRIRRS